MDIDQPPNSHIDPPSDCKSFESNYRACSQPRKISRGILIDSSAKFGPKNANKEALMQCEQYPPPSKANPAEDGNRVEAVSAIDTGKNPRSLVQETSHPLSSRSFHQKITTGAVQHPTKSNCNESSESQFDSVIVGRKGSNAEGIEKRSFATAQEVVVEDKTEKPETRGCETLRMKLWEILGTVSSPNKQRLNDYDLKVGDKDLESPQKNNGEHNPVVKPQNSDTIESDSEFPNETVTRPMSRSFCRKRASNKLKANRTRSARSTYYKDIEGKNTPCFREGFSARISYGIHGGSLKENENENHISATKACKTCSLDQGNQGENQQVRNHREVIPSAERSLSHGNGGGDDKEFHCRRETEFIDPKCVAPQRDSHQSPLVKMSANPRNVIDSPKSQENVKWQDGYSFLKNTRNEMVDAKSPTFEMRAPTKISFPGFLPTEIKTPTESFSDGSPPKKQPGGSDYCSHAGMIFDTKGIQCFKSWLASKSNHYRLNSQINYSDDAGEHEDPPIVNPRPGEEEEPENRMCKSSGQDSDSETSGVDSHIKGYREPELHLPKCRNTKKSTYMLHLNKKQRFLDGTKITGFCPTFAARKVTGVEEHSKFQQDLEFKQEDGLTREVALFAFALKRFKSKMNSVARKRSAEILMSVAERINSQLQNAERQIQEDVGKLTNHSKSKRKHLEMRCQELQGELKAMHERLKEEVNQHLQHCRSTVEGLEAYQMELRVTAEKQRASNRKLLLQAEAAIEAELSDAKRRITMIQNSARGKMLQLKNFVAGCLKEGILS